MDMYDSVAREVAPKKAKLMEAEKSFAATIELLREKRAEVTRLELRLQELNEQLVEAAAEQSRLQETVDLCTVKLQRAKQLIDGLGGERTRWTETARSLEAQYETIAGDVLISCGTIAYLSPFNLAYRQKIIKEWNELCMEYDIPCTTNFDFIEVLGSPIEIQKWNFSGLPRDIYSAQNAIIQATSKRWSLLIDPQNQANFWIKKMEKTNNLHVIKLTDGNYMKVIEQCIEMGAPVLIENIYEELEAPLDPVLTKSIFQQGGQAVIALGDSVVHYNPRFKLYLTCTLRNPHFPPEVFNKVTIVNFALARDGLEDQLLGIVVAKERPDLQTLREEIVSRSAENSAALQLNEELILKTLSETKGDILEDETAIKILNHSKVLSEEIKVKQEAGREAEEKIERFRAKYRPVAVHSSLLYYCICDLPNIDPMYQFSLNWFIQLYSNNIDSSVKTRDIEKRIKTLIESFTLNLYQSICRSLFEKDKLLFSFILSTKILESKGIITEEEILFLLSGGIPVENKEENPAKSWLENKKWDEICRLSNIRSLRGFKDSFVKNLSYWNEFYNSSKPEALEIPEPWRSRLEPFHKLIILRALRLDKMTSAIRNFIKELLGQAYISPPPFDIEKSYSDSNCVTPLIFILSPGADPMTTLQKFAQKRAIGLKFESISMGQGQGSLATAMIRRGMENGSWVCLQNCHVLTSWLPQLEVLIEQMDINNTKDSFRIWLTSYPTSKFPPNILQRSVKMTNEIVTGLKQNLLRNYMQEPLKDRNFYNACQAHDLLFTKLLYSISFFHAIVLERRTFGSLGWNIPYGFNDSDFNISVQQVLSFLNEYEEVSYVGMSYMIGECNYGGRVTDDWDRRLLNTILDGFVTPELHGRAIKFSEVGQWYGMPKKTEYSEVVKHITQMPTEHPPEVFGLHSNASIAKDLGESLRILEAGITVYGDKTSSAGKDTDALLLKMINDITSKLPQPFNIQKASLRYPVDYEESMNTVLIQELHRFNTLLAAIATSLKSLQDAIHGLIVMTPDLELLAQSILLGKVPAMWKRVSYPSLKTLPAYISDLVLRIDFFDVWESQGKPIVFWLPGFFFTQSFLTGAKQNFARKAQIPIDQLDFDYKVFELGRPLKPPTNGVQVEGLYLEGASWAKLKGMLQEQRDRILYDPMPIIWIQVVETEHVITEGKYKCPLYKTVERRGTLSTTGHSTNYVVPVLLNTGPVNPSHWIKRSVALFLQLN